MKELDPKTKKILKWTFISLILLTVILLCMFLLGGHYTCDPDTKQCKYNAFVWNMMWRSKCKSYCNYSERSCFSYCIESNGKPSTGCQNSDGTKGNCCELSDFAKDCSGCKACVEHCKKPCY